MLGHHSEKLIKGNSRKRKAEDSNNAECGVQRQPSDSGIDVGSSGVSGSRIRLQARTRAQMRAQMLEVCRHSGRI